MTDPHSYAEDRSWAAWDGCQEEEESTARQPPTRSRTTTTSAACTRGTVERADGAEARRLTVYLPVDLYRRVKLHVAGLDCNLSEFVADVLDRELLRSA